jgi:hypothetical protein
MDVISVHVPKTAGCTFRNTLFQVYGQAQTRLDYDDEPQNPTSRYHVDREGWRASADEEIRAIDPAIRVIHGHFAVEKYEGLFPEAARITWVRHPVPWPISLYYFWKNIPPVHNPPTHPLIRRIHLEGASFEEFIEEPVARNQVTNMFLGSKPLESFAFVGIQEHFDADLKDLARMMGWPELGVEPVNRNPEPSYEARLGELFGDPRLIDRIVSLNEQDMALYEKAVRLRARRHEQAKARLDRRARRVAIHRGDRQHQDQDFDVA